MTGHGLASHQTAVRQPSPRERMVLDFIRNYAEEHHGRPPSFREIAAALDRCVTTVYHQVDVLERKGFVERDHRQSRSVRVVA